MDHFYPIQFVQNEKACKVGKTLTYMLERTPIVSNTIAGTVYYKDLLIHTIFQVKDEWRIDIINPEKICPRVISVELQNQTGLMTFMWDQSINIENTKLVISYEYNLECQDLPQQNYGPPPGRQMTAEDFRDKIKPPLPPKFKVGERIAREELAGFIDKPNLNEESFSLSGRSWRVGHYALDRQHWCKKENLKEKFLKFMLNDYSHHGECTENGIIDCRTYVFVEDGDMMKCESFYNSMSGFYDQMIDQGDSIMIWDGGDANLDIFYSHQFVQNEKASLYEYK
jgi:hypothetical protein